MATKCKSPNWKGGEKNIMNYKKVLVSAAAGVSLLLNTAMPVFAGTTLVISGNGSDSDNEAKIDVDQTTTVTQTNETSISNNVNATASSGGNSASRNTGGAVLVDTGDATTDVKVTNLANSNEATVDCCMANSDMDVLIEGNGADSKNKAKLDIDSSTNLYQTNDAKITNKVNADATSGENRANRNTGGDVEILTGKASTDVDIETAANSNSALVSSNGGTGSISLKILENGADSDNKIKLDFDHAVLLTQANDARVKNDVWANANSGDNRANRNTGGDVLVDTGDAHAGVEVDTMVNFNWADVDCGCLFDVFAKVAGNGDNSKNEIKAYLDDTTTVFQDNSCGGYRGPQGFELLFGRFGRHHKDCVSNYLDAYAGSGGNRADRNTGDPEGDPSVLTGNAETLVDVENSGGSNVYGAASEWDWSGWPMGGLNLSISLDLHALLVALGLA